MKLSFLRVYIVINLMSYALQKLTFSQLFRLMMIMCSYDFIAYYEQKIRLIQKETLFVFNIIIL